MLDAISVFLGAISILQNVKSKQSLKEKVDELQRASAQIRRVHDFLFEAKEFHDEFELLDMIAVAPLLSKIHNARGDMNTIGEALEAFLQQETRIVKNKKLNPREADAEDLDDRTPVRTNLAKLNDIYPEFRSGLKDYIESIDRLQQLYKVKNFGQNLLDENDVMRSLVDRVRVNSDQIILNTVPIIIFLQYELDNAIVGLT